MCREREREETGMEEERKADGREEKTNYGVVSKRIKGGWMDRGRLGRLRRRRRRS